MAFSLPLVSRSMANRRSAVKASSTSRQEGNDFAQLKRAIEAIDQHCGAIQKQLHEKTERLFDDNFDEKTFFSLDNLQHCIVTEAEQEEMTRSVQQALNRLHSPVIFGDLLSPPPPLEIPQHLSRFVREMKTTLLLSRFADKTCNMACERLFEGVAPKVGGALVKSACAKLFSSLNTGTFFLERAGASPEKELERVRLELRRRLRGVIDRWIFHVKEHWRQQVIDAFFPLDEA
ncbi:hypothetical protein GTO89_00495 [Heliobacterium gestii]|uniref:Uncharacterized protein n=1 Tax=Heliomicrobium gestii TaxID=2699 RepID=A0A845L7D7_HELGE|nr:hypothetical protein [Heliomicrobium gestii]MBM7865246.1 hypothetical protein [Heliomicrobium gestii]MZP41511.1 hypothetical protein [Heliomicrobium gestii]